MAEKTQNIITKYWPILMFLGTLIVQVSFMYFSINEIKPKVDAIHTLIIRHDETIKQCKEDAREMKEDIRDLKKINRIIAETN